MTRSHGLRRSLANHHRSFNGWYWRNKACLTPYFADAFIAYVNDSSREARRLTPKAKILTAPYGTHQAVCDDTFVRQLEKFDVDTIAYQDEVGCLRMGPAESARAFAGHPNSPRLCTDYVHWLKSR